MRVAEDADDYLTKWKAQTMLSHMESSPTPDQAALVLEAAEASRDQLAGRLVVPPAFFTSIGAALAVQIASAAVGIARQDARGMLLLMAGAAVFALTAALQLARFRRRNGVWLAGLANRVVLGTATTASTVYVVTMGAAVWAAFSGAWWLVLVASVVGGVGYGLAGRHWLRIYRGVPEAHGQPGSRAWLALVVLASIAGLVALVIES